MSESQNKTLKRGALYINGWAGHGNPHRVGVLLRRKGRRDAEMLYPDGHIGSVGVNALVEAGQFFTLRDLRRAAEAVEDTHGGVADELAASLHRQEYGQPEEPNA